MVNNNIKIAGLCKIMEQVILLLIKQLSLMPAAGLTCNLPCHIFRNKKLAKIVQSIIICITIIDFEGGSHVFRFYGP